MLTKNTAAKTAVVRDMKFAPPVAPNKLPEPLLPNAAPMSAPLPCCTKIKPIITKADFGDVANVVYKFLTLEIGAFFVASAQALTFRDRARVLRQELDSE